MKKFLALFLAFCMIATSMVFVPLTVAAENATITVTDADSLEQAFKDIPDGGTIVIEGTITYSAESTIGSGTGKNVTVTGGTIDASAVNLFHIKDNVTFDKITLKFKNLFASGYKLVITEDVTAEASAVFGGDCYKDCGPTDITILAGKYTHIIGASRGGHYINGDVKVTVGGTAEVTTAVFGTGWDKSSINGSSYITLCGEAVASRVYGSGPSGTVITGDTHVTVEGSADVKEIYGGGESGSTVNGNAFVTVTGDANPGATPSESNHNCGYFVFGGGNGTVEKNTYVDFNSNGAKGEGAKTGYIVGGSAAGGAVNGNANLLMSGGTSYHIYGCGRNIDGVAGDVNVTMTGGTVWQVFGGCESASMEGNIMIKLLGGTVKRRVYGGCYNDTSGLSISTNRYVNGEITLVLGGVNVDFSSSDNDRSIYARSRHSDRSQSEKATIVFADQTAYNNNKGKLTAQDSAMQWIIGSISAADNQHIYAGSISNGVITHTCTLCNTTSTANIAPNGTTYTGEAIETTITYSDNWQLGTIGVSYENNVNAGTATATLDVCGVGSLTYDYQIAQAIITAPVVTVSGNKVIGLTTEMEYSTNGVNYTPVADANMDFAAGRYFIRYAKNYTSPSTKVLIIRGNYVFANSVYAVSGNEVEITVSAPESLGEITATVTYGGSSKDVTFTGSGKVTFTASDSAEVTVSCNKADVTLVNGYITVVEKIAGDLSGNGVIDLSDIVALRKLIASPSTNELADVNGDGEINSADVVILRQYLASYSFEVNESIVDLYN